MEQREITFFRAFELLGKNDTQNVFTPPKLIREMLSRVKFTADCRVLVWYNVEFLIYLVREIGLSPKNIYIYTNTQDKIILEKNGYKVIYQQEINLTKVIKQFKQMNFDTVLGNPPYNELDENGRSKSNSGNHLYSKFIEASFDLVKPGGYVSLITPIHWTGYDAKVGKKFRENAIHFLNLSECKKYFNEGTTFSYYVVEKGGDPNLPTQYISEFANNIYSGTTILFEKFPFIPQVLNQDSLNIFEKVYFNTFPKYSYTRDCSLHSQNVSITKTTSEYPAFHFSHDNGFYSQIPHPTLHGVKKIMVAPGRTGLKSREFGFFDSEGFYSPTQNSINTVVLTNEEGLQKLAFLKSNLVKFLLQTTETGSFWEKKMLTNLPFLPTCDEEEMYNLLGITETEKSLINESIK
jgi:hypothetical protein